MSDSEFEVSPVDYHSREDEIRKVRFEVFVSEQKVPAELEMDEWDERSLHVLAIANGEAIGTGRLLPDGHIGRVSVLKDWRGKGVGVALMNSLMQLADRVNYPELILSAQTQAQAFYERLGFTTTGAPYQEAGIEHIEMRLKR